MRLAHLVSEVIHDVTVETDRDAYFFRRRRDNRSAYPFAEVGYKINFGGSSGFEIACPLEIGNQVRLNRPPSEAVARFRARNRQIDSHERPEPSEVIECFRR